MNYVVVVTGPSSGFGALAARALALAGHTVYASMRETKGRNAAQVKELGRYAADHGVDLRSIELDVGSEKSCEAAIQEIVLKNGRLDVLVHNAGHMVFGPAEAFTPEQLTEQYDVNVWALRPLPASPIILRTQDPPLTARASPSTRQALTRDFPSKFSRPSLRLCRPTWM
jgi:NAD(P)-dependent dehydrogenase (short-subunit alcohol dehydrogenase family)